MADRPGNSTGENRVRPYHGSPPAMPRWVKMFGLIAAMVLVVLFVILHLSGLGGLGSHH
jgi:hypothetical protein